EDVVVVTAYAKHLTAVRELDFEAARGLAQGAGHVCRSAHTGTVLTNCGRMKAREWIDEFAARLGVDPPSADEFSAILDLAGEAAHSSERVAAPAAAWLAAKAGRTPEDALAVAKEIACAS